MKNLRFCLLLFICLITLLPIPLLAEEASFESRYNITHLDAIQQNEIFDIHQDSRGFMWIATLDGLVRYDGYKTKTYRMEMGKNSLSSNMIFRIQEDNHGNIWLATFGKGLCKLDIKSDRFIHFSKTNTSLIKENSFNFFLLDPPYIWTGEQSNLIRYELDSTMSHFLAKTNIDYTKLNGGPSKAGIRVIHKDFHSNIWVGTTAASIKIGQAYGEMDDMVIDTYGYGAFTFLNYYPTMLIGGESLYFPSTDAQGKEFLEYLSYDAGFITHRQGFTLWLGSVSGIEAYSWDDRGLIQQSNFSNYLPFQYIKEKKISCLENDAHGNLWIGSRGGGVDIISAKKEGIYHFAPSKQKGSIQSKLIKVVYEDSKEDLWIGTEDKGVNYLVDKDRYNYNSGFSRFDIDNYPEEYNRAYSFVEQLTPDSKEQERLLWIGTSFPIFLIAIDPETMEQKKLAKVTEELGFVFALAIQNNNTIWAGTYDRGLWQLKTNKDGDIIDAKQFKHNEDNPYSIPSDIIRDVMVDSNNNLWLTTDNGLSKVLSEDIAKDNITFHNFSQTQNAAELSYDYLLQLYESPTGQIWMGSMGGGLIGIKHQISKDSIVFFSITEKDGLPDNTIKGIIEDDKGSLWLSSNKGIFRYNPKDHSIVSYDVEDGLQDNYFSEMTFCKRHNGDIIFGGYEGFNVIRPDQLKTDSVLPHVYFTEFSVLNQSSEEVLWDKINQSPNTSVEFSKSIVLRHNENSFSIGFSGLHFNAAHKNKYEYQLVGFDKKTSTVNAENSVVKYTNIPRGTYQFEVLAANCDNIWTTEPIILNIRIKPHPLTSVLAWVIYALLFILAVIATYQIIHLFHKRKNEIIIAGIERQKAEELSQSKLRFFTNISHEFRTPLTLISIPLERILNSQQKFTDENSNNLNIIQQNTKGLLRLVNQILDFRKLEQNKMMLQAQEEDVIPFATETVKAYEPLLQEKQIKFVFKHDTAKLFFDYDPDKLEKILNNLISNAIKFTPEQGQIVLNISEQDGFVKLKVNDTGPGIPIDEQELVFVRYHQQSLRQARKHSGTGIGLSLTKAMVELHNGDIHLESEMGKGSTFIVTLPKKQTFVSLDNKIEISEEEHIIEDYDSAEVLDSLDIAADKTYSLLVVEDNQDLRQLVVSVFAEDYKVAQAKDGQEGYELCLKEKPDLIISDVMMPRMSGLELLSKVKGEESISHTPVILLTAKSTVEDQVKGHLAGADAYLPKPFNIEVLKAKVKSVFENRARLKRKFQKEIEINPLTIANSPGDVNFMERVLKIIEKNMSDYEFNIEKLAYEYGISRMGLTRKIKALTGETPLQFLRNIRLKQAADLLKNNDIPVSTAAWEVGFNDLATFRKHFKEQFGLSPSAYVNRHKG